MAPRFGLDAGLDFPGTSEQATPRRCWARGAGRSSVVESTWTASGRWLSPGVSGGSAR